MPPRIPPPEQEVVRDEEEEDEEAGSGPAESANKEVQYLGNWRWTHDHCLCFVRLISWCRFPLGNTAKVAWKIPFVICSAGVALLIYYTATRAATITAQENSAG